MAKTVSVALVGICGYGAFYVRRVLDAKDRNLRVVAAIARRPQRCELLPKLKGLGAQIYIDLEQFYKEETADLVVISSPIQLHAPFTCTALSNGSNVLCEKPVAATIQDTARMAEAEKAAAGRFVAIGYQWSFSDAIQALKHDVLKGDMGRPVQLKTLVSWPRNKTYYQRNAWAGAVKASEGSWVLDSPANNATAHYLHNMFYILGKTRETSAFPIEVRGERYRANPIENFDTAALRCRTADGTEILFYTSHAVPSIIGPVIRYEFEEASVFYEADSSRAFIARFRDGHTRSYGDPNATAHNKLWQSVEAVRTGAPVACGVETATAHVLCINGLQESSPEVVGVPADMVNEEGDAEKQLRWIAGLQAAFVQCYDQGLLPAEHGGLPWALEAKTVDLRNYRSFPST